MSRQQAMGWIQEDKMSPEGPMSHCQVLCQREGGREGGRERKGTSRGGDQDIHTTLASPVAGSVPTTHGLSTKATG